MVPTAGCIWFVPSMGGISMVWFLDRVPWRLWFVIILMECPSSHFWEGINIRGLVTPCKIIITGVTLYFQSTLRLLGLVITGRRSSLGYVSWSFSGGVPRDGGHVCVCGTKLASWVSSCGKSAPSTSPRSSHKSAHRWSPFF